MTTWLSLLTAATPLLNIVEDAYRAHDRLLKFNATVVSRHGTITTQHRQVVWDIQVARPNRVRLSQDFITGNRPNPPTIIVNGDRLFIVDPKLRQYTEQPVKGKSLVEKVKKSNMPIEEFVLAVLDEGGMTDFIKRKTKQHKLKLDQNTLRSADYALTFDRRTRYAQAIMHKSGKDTFSWTLAIEGSPPDSAFLPPAGFTKVRAFKASAAPSTANTKSKEALNKVLGFYDRDRSLAYSTFGTHGQTKVWLSGDGRAKEAFDGWEWVYAKGKLIARSLPRKTAYTGTATPSQLSSKLARIGGIRSPLLADLVCGQNPVRRWIGPDFTVSHAGTMKLKGTEIGILRSVSKDLRISLQYRVKDGAVTQVTVEALGNGPPRLTSQTNFVYQVIGSKIDSSQFQLSTAGFRVVSIDRI